MPQETMPWTQAEVTAFDVVDGQFVVVTADAADLRPYAPLSALLRRVRKAFAIDAVFISEWAGGEPIVRSCEPDGAFAGAHDAPSLQVLYGMTLLDSHAYDGAASFDAVPVITADGLQYGTLCCRMPARDGDSPGALGSVARLIARWFDEAELNLSGLLPLQGHSMMGGMSGLAPLTAY